MQGFNRTLVNPPTTIAAHDARQAALAQEAELRDAARQSSRQDAYLVRADCVWKGDIVANHGVVTDTPRRDGVFVIVTVYGSQWFLGTGRGNTLQKEIVFHAADSVVLDGRGE